MKISLIIPPNHKDWQGNIIRELIAFRHIVIINKCDKDCDVIIAMSHTQWPIIKKIHIEFPNIPLITLNWDWYDYIDKKKDGWPEFTQLMRESKEVWTSSKTEADKCEKETGIKSSFYTYAFIQPWEWNEEVIKDYGYIIQASRKDKNKRFDMFKKTSSDLNIPFKAYHPGYNSRIDYINTMKNCSFSVLASREESIGGLTTMEASYCNKPALISDCDGNKEVWGDDVNYFKKDSKEDFKKQLQWLWENYKTKEVQEKVKRANKKVNDKFMPWIMAKRFTERLDEIL